MHIQRDLAARCAQLGQRLALIVIDNMCDGDLDENRPSIMSANDIDAVDAYRDLFPELCQRPQLGGLHNGRLTETPIIEPMGTHALQRSTPPSVRFLGRKVYLGVIVVLLTALHHGLTEARCRRLLEALEVPLQTLWRWRRWWREQFAQTRCWRALAGRFMPPLAVDQLPGSLLERLDGSALSERVVQLLVLIAPTTTATGSARVSADPQKM